MTQSWDVPNVDWPTLQQQIGAMVYGALME
jgi:hypothetical protein